MPAHMPSDASVLKFVSVGCTFDGSMAMDSEFIFEALNLVIKVGSEALPIPSHTVARIMAPVSFSMGFFLKTSINASSVEKNGSTVYQKWVSIFWSSKPMARWGSKPFGAHLRISSLDFPIRIGKFSSVLLGFGCLKNVLIAYSPMQTIACFGSIGFNVSIWCLMLSRTSNVVLPSFIRGTYITFKKSLAKLRF